MVPPTLEDRTAAGDNNGSANKKRKASVSYGHYNHYKGLNTSMIQSKFLSNPEDLGVVAVGFSGGQVRSPPASTPTTGLAVLSMNFKN
jgi:arginase